MKYSEAGEKIEALSNKFSVAMEQGDFHVAYDGEESVYVNGSHQYDLYVDYHMAFIDMPFHDRVYKILAELAATPLEERVEKKRHYVKIFDGPLGFLNVNTNTNRMNVYDQDEVGAIKTKFTDKEIEGLKARDDVAIDWNKVSLWDAE